MNHPSANPIIVALSTPPGVGALALIRISGDGSIDLVQKVFSRTIEDKSSHTVHHGWIQDGEKKIDDVVLTLFRNPKSFTGEDTAEIACHGSPYIIQTILQLLLKHGAQMAQPGEFSMRAYLRGKMDLSQAEAIADLIASENEAMHKQALHQMRGGFSKEIHALREQLIAFASLVELELDFAEEDVEFADRTKLRELVLEIEKVVLNLRDSFSLGNAIKNGVPVAILGAPNAGKSTLLNALLNEDRAIVSDIAGTTRDTVEDTITLNGIKFIFIDTAGLRDTEDVIEKMGIERSYAKARSASIIILLVDLSRETAETITAFINDVKTAVQTPGMASRPGLASQGAAHGHEAPGMAPLRADQKYILVGNKADLIAIQDPAQQSQQLSTLTDFPEMIMISAKHNKHIEELKSQIADSVQTGRIHSGETIVTNLRHFEALNKAATSIADIRHGMDQRITGDFLAIDIRKTLYHLGEIIGEVNADDLLNSIFSRFCIGK